MALVKSEDVAAQVRGLSRLSVFRQIGVLAGLAASIALGTWVALWSQTPNYQVLFSNLSDTDASQITEELQKQGVQYKVNERSGTIMVPGDAVHKARMKLAGEGLPKGSGIGFELLEHESGFGTSQFIETARYQRALEGELARTISSLDNVKDARVHLAIPEQPSFIRNRRKPSASVMVILYPGRNLGDGQVAAITHLVSSSIPNLDPDRVTVVDQKGQLLTSPDGSQSMGLSSNQFEYKRKVEQYYEHQIEDLLTPIMGSGKVRAQVSADMDFTAVDETKESYNPDLPAIRSEQTVEQKTVDSVPPQGVPGALSNQPPGPVQAGTAQSAAGTGSQSQNQTPVNTTRRSTRNYELDRTISHTRMPSGAVQRLSVAVVVDNLQSADDKNGGKPRPLTQQELDRLTGLVKEAVGFNAARGDSVSVINIPFSVPPAPAPLPKPSLWEQPWLWSSLKVAGAGALILVLVFGVLRPVLRELVAKGKVMPEPPALEASQGGHQLTAQQAAGRLMAPSQDYQTNLSKAKNIAAQDPKVAAQVVKNWVVNDA